MFQVNLTEEEESKLRGIASLYYQGDVDRVLKEAVERFIAYRENQELSFEVRFARSLSRIRKNVKDSGIDVEKRVEEAIREVRKNKAGN